MAARKIIAFDADGFTEEVDQANDTFTMKGLTMTGEIAMGSNKLTGLANGTAPADGVNYSQLQAATAGLKWKAPVRAKAQGNINIAAPGASIDGVAMSAGQRFAAFSQTTTTQDGIYEWNGAASAATRASDFAAASAQANAAFFVEEGTTDADTSWTVTNDQGSDVVGTDDLVLVAFSGSSSIPDATSGSGGAVKGKVTFDSDKGLSVTAGVAEVTLAANPGLQFTGGALDVLEAPNGGLEVVAAGVQIKLDGTTLQTGASGASVKGLPSLFEVNGVATTAGVTAANLNTLTDGSNADALHVHASSSPTINADTGGVTIGDPIYVSGSDVVSDADAATGAEAKAVIGIAGNTATVGNPVTLLNDGDVLAGALVGATAGDIYYLAVGGGLTASLPGSGNFRVAIGTAKNATDLVINTQYLGKAA